MEIKIGAIGAVDNAKTTTVACLTNDILDDGRGSARVKVFRYPHELETGRTSSIAKVYLKTGQGTYITFVDLAGHEKYLKTTCHGITANKIDYAMMVVGANMGVTKMTKEHLRMVIQMRVPVFFIVTKIDICPANRLEETIEEIKHLVKKTGRYGLGISLLGQKPYDGAKDVDEDDDIGQGVGIKDGRESGEVESRDAEDEEGSDDSKGKQKDDGSLVENQKFVEQLDQLINCYRQREFFNVCPVFITSNKTGANLDLLKYFVHHLPVRKDVVAEESSGEVDLCQKLFRIQEKFYVKGVGIVVSGTVIKGRIKKGDNLYMGPVFGQWTTVTVKNIHDNFRTDVPWLVRNQTGCLALNFHDKKIKITRNKIRKGVILGDQCYPLARNFRARIAVTIGHSTTIKKDYQPIINCETIVQTARVMEIDQEVIRSGTVAEIKFRFEHRPEFLEKDYLFIFREGNLRGVGRVMEILGDDYFSQGEGASPKEIRKMKYPGKT